MKELSQEVEKILRKIYIKKGPIFAEIILNWARIVGVQYIITAYPTRISEFVNSKKQRMTTLHIEVSSSSASLILSHQQGIIIERIAQYFGYQAITNLRFYVHPR